MYEKKIIRVAVQHEEAIVQAGIEMLLKGYDDIVSTLPTPTEERAETDVLIVDYRQGSMLLARNAGGKPPMLIVTHHDREWDLLEAFKAGASGYILQHCAPEELLTAVRVIAGGERFLSPALSGIFLASQGKANLTIREDQVLRLLAQGCCNKEIARQLGIGLGTVKTHAKGLFTKLGATARTHAVALATKRGLISDLHRIS